MRKIGLFIIAIVLALGALGVGYAEWSQAMTITGTVETGWLGASFENPNPGSTPLSDGIATIEASVGSSSAGLEDGGGNLINDVLTISVKNAYPGYTGKVYFDIYNTGSIPITVSVNEDDILIRDINLDDASSYFGVVTSIDPSVVIPYGESGNYHNDYVQISIPQAAVPMEDSTYTISIPLTVNQNTSTVIPQP
jgi:hypothetical protein